MYEDLLQTSARPFRATPDEKFYFPHESIETARTTSIRAVRRAEGPVMVLGGVGLGKSLVGELIASELREEYDLVRLSAARLCSRRALLQNILYELHQPFRDLSEGELRISIMARLQPKPEYAPDGILILVDEAHTLPTKLLEELRLITNFTRNGQPRVRLVLIGGMQLEDTFASPQLESFNQRLAARCYLIPMSREQTRQYVAHQIQVAGYTASQLITEDGLQSVYAASEGVPRLVNQVMDHALVLAMSDDRYPMNAQLIEEAWADLQQLPAPWQTTADLQPQAGAAGVEFGELGDDDSDFSSLDIPAAGFPHANAHTTDNGQAVVAASGFITQDSVSESNSARSTIPDDAVVTIDSFSSQTVWPQQDEAWTDGFADAAEDSVSTELAAQTDSLLDAQPSRTDHADGEQNFFAAFERSEQMELLDDTHSDPPAQESESHFDPLEKPEVEIVDVYKAFASGRHQAGHEYVELNQTLPVDSYFENRPTDEKLIALEDEQRQYDMMGVWENDPPLPATELSSDSEEDAAMEPKPAMDSAIEVATVEAVPTSSDTVSEAAKVDLPPSQTVQVDLSPAALFGEDFEEEFAISRELPATSLTADSDAGNNRDIVHSWNTVQSVVADFPEMLSAEQQAATDVEPDVDLTETRSDETASHDFEPIDIAQIVTTDSLSEVAPRESDGVAAGDYSVSEMATDSDLEAEVPLEPNRLSEALVTDQLDRIHQFADDVSDMTLDDATVESVLESMQRVDSDVLFATGDFADGHSPRGLEIHTLEPASELLVHEEIEDLVSQLNFSAFAVEPFSIEQITLKPQVDEPEKQADKDIPDERIRADVDPRSLSQASDFFNIETALYDDDRDLLVIEEDIVKVVPTATTDEGQRPTRTAPYAQLFAKLRK